MPSQVTASVVVNFNATRGGSLAAEVDSRPDGYNDGRTSFGAGDEPAILVFASSDVSIDSVVPSAGVVTLLGGGTMLIEEDIQFQDKREADLGRAFYNAFEWKWVGNNLGVPVPSENKIIVPTKGVGILRVKYNALFAAFRVEDVPYPLNGETEFPVLIVVTGTKA